MRAIDRAGRRIRVRLAAGALVAATTASALAGCSMLQDLAGQAGDAIDQAGSALQQAREQLDGAFASGQEWWNGTSENLQQLGDGLQQALGGVDLSAISGQVEEVCALVLSDASTDTIEQGVQTLVEQATGAPADAATVAQVVDAATQYCQP